MAKTSEDTKNTERILLVRDCEVAGERTHFAPEEACFYEHEPSVIEPLIFRDSGQRTTARLRVFICWNAERWSPKTQVLTRVGMDPGAPEGDKAVRWERPLTLDATPVTCPVCHASVSEQEPHGHQIGDATGLGQTRRTIYIAKCPTRVSE